MKRKITLGKYELIDDTFWISREDIPEGTVRMIEGDLYYSERYKIENDHYATYDDARLKHEFITRWYSILDS